jgi:hypothetical protein
LAGPSRDFSICLESLVVGIEGCIEENQLASYGGGLGSGDSDINPMLEEPLREGYDR